MPADRITAEDVVEEARALLRSTIPLRVEASDPDEEMAERAFWESANRLEDLLSRYDAQPKPRWLKPEEAVVPGQYWIWEPEMTAGLIELPSRLGGVFRIQAIFGTRELCVFDWEPDRSLPLRTEELSRYRLYGPLPEPPPPPEGEDE